MSPILAHLRPTETVCYWPLSGAKRHQAAVAEQSRFMSTRPTRRIELAYELKDLTGSLWPNEDKAGDNYPSYRGSAKIGGIDHWVSLWKKTSKTGKVYLSLSFKPKVEKPQVGPGGARPSLRDELDDAIPF